MFVPASVGETIMTKSSSHRFTEVLRGILLLTVCTPTLHAAAPTGWCVAGNKPTEYESGIDPLATHNDRPSAYLKSKLPSVHGFGTLIEDFRADQYVGKRVRFSAFVKTANAKNWAGLWMRVDKGLEATCLRQYARSAGNRYIDLAEI